MQNKSDFPARKVFQEEIADLHGYCQRSFVAQFSQELCLTSLSKRLKNDLLYRKFEIYRIDFILPLFIHLSFSISNIEILFPVCSETIQA